MVALQNYISTTISFYSPITDRGYYEFEMFEKSLLRKKRLSFLFFEKIARKIILKNN
jgi:hypothetical protein